MCVRDWKRYCMKGRGERLSRLCFHQGLLKARLSHVGCQRSSLGVAINFTARDYFHRLYRRLFLQYHDSSFRPNSFQCDVLSKTSVFIRLLLTCDIKRWLFWAFFKKHNPGDSLSTRSSDIQRRTVGLLFMAVAKFIWNIKTDVCRHIA